MYFCLVVVGGDSCPRGCEFESQYGILPRWIIFHIYLLLLWCLKRPAFNNMHTMNDKGPWMWLSWQSGCFRHQRSTVWNPLSAKFILNVVSCQLYWKDENNKKIKAGNGPFFNNELHEWQARSAKTLVKLKLEVIPIWVVDNTKPRDLRSVWHDKIIAF